MTGPNRTAGSMGRGRFPNLGAAGSYSGGYDERFTPRFHFTPGEGRINAPNGLVLFGDEYHLFFQHNPSGDT